MINIYPVRIVLKKYYFCSGLKPEIVKDYKLSGGV